MRRAVLLPVSVIVPSTIGLFIAFGGTVVLVEMLRGIALRGGGEVAFKAGYSSLVAVGVCLALGLGWLLSQKWGLSSLLVAVLILVLLGAAFYPLALMSSAQIDCAVSVKFPLWTPGCD